MKTYTKHDYDLGVHFTIDSLTIPECPNNRHYIQMLEEVEAGEAQIVEGEADPLPGDVE